MLFVRKASASDNEKCVSENEKCVSDNEKCVSDNEKCVSDNEKHRRRRGPVVFVVRAFRSESVCFSLSVLFMVRAFHGPTQTRAIGSRERPA